MRIRVPIIFIPGLFGSMSSDIVKGTGAWSFGVSSYVYNSFITMLEEMGYTLDKDLFIAYYDWRKPCEISARVYLQRKIKEAKNRTGASKVNLIGHSMGGLVARAYIQSNYYGYDVLQLIQLGTPNSGTAPNYSYWIQGDLPVKSKISINFVRLYINIYLESIKKNYQDNYIEGIHDNFRGLKDIIPSHTYGDYIYHSREDIMYFKSIKHMYVQNRFLNELNQNMDIIHTRDVEVTIIAGRGLDTINYLKVKNTSDTSRSQEVVDFNTTREGDGNALINSVFTLDGDKYVIDGAGHINILYESKSIIKSKLG